MYSSLYFAVLKRDDDNSTRTDISECGINFCPDTELGDSGKITDENQLYTLAGTYLGCSVLAWILVSVFLDPLSRYYWSCKNKDTI